MARRPVLPRPKHGYGRAGFDVVELSNHVHPSLELLATELADRVRALTPA